MYMYTMFKAEIDVWRQITVRKIDIDEAVRGSRM